MNQKERLYEPIINFRKDKPQMQIQTITHDKLYENAFFPAEEPSQSEYAQNTTAWD